MKLGQNTITRPEVGQRSSGLAKTHEGYWKGRLRRRTYRDADGSEREIPSWQVKLFRDGRQRWVNLDTDNKDAAARKARDHWLQLKTNGWDAVKPKREKIMDPTVGDFLTTVRAVAGLLPATFEIYAKKFRRLVAGVAGIKAGMSKHDYKGGGYKKWLVRVEAVRLSRLTPEAVQRWQTRYIAAAGTNPLKDRRARRTIVSVLRSSKALFAPRIVRQLLLQLPNPLPLAGVEIPRVKSIPYESKINPLVLFQQAQRELEAPAAELVRSDIGRTERAEQHTGKRKLGLEARTRRIERTVARELWLRREMFKILCLGLFAGLRRDEIDTLTWEQIDFAQKVIRIETNEFTHAKSDSGKASVDIDSTLAELIRTWMTGSKSKFVINSGVEPRPKVSTYHHYRCGLLFKRLNAWLKDHGVDERKALHTLRKEFGTQINRTHGLFAASAALRHSSIQLTRAVYVAKKDPAVFAMPAASPQSKEVAS